MEKAALPVPTEPQILPFMEVSRPLCSQTSSLLEWLRGRMWLPQVFHSIVGWWAGVGCHVSRRLGPKLTHTGPPESQGYRLCGGLVHCRWWGKLFRGGPVLELEGCILQVVSSTLVFVQVEDLILLCAGQGPAGLHF